MRLRQDRRLAFGVAFGGALLLVAYTLGLVLTPPASVRWFQINVVYNLPGLVTLIFALIRMSGARGRERLGWFSLASDVVLLATRGLVLPYYDVVLGRDVPSPGFTDVVYYAGYVGFAAAIPLLVVQPRQQHDPDGCSMAPSSSSSAAYCLRPSCWVRWARPPRARVSRSLSLWDIRCSISPSEAYWC